MVKLATGAGNYNLREKMEKEIVNKVSESGLVQFDLEELHQPGKRILLDIKGWLFEEMVLKEKDFREHIKNHNWNQYQNTFVAVTCSADAIIPTWAFMLIATKLSGIAKKIVFGNLEKLEEELFSGALLQLNPEDYKNQRVVIKGCSNVKVPVQSYVQLTTMLTPFAKSIMYGEPCSTVPLYKK